jgi:hypothetical protein
VRAAGHCAAPDRAGGVLAVKSSSFVPALPDCLPIRYQLEDRDLANWIDFAARERHEK